MDERRRAIMAGVLGMLLQMVVGGLILIVSLWSSSSACAALGFFAAATSLVWAIAFLHTRQVIVAKEEERDYRETEKRGALFEDQDLGTLSARAGLRRLERYLLPTATIIIGLGLIVIAILLYLRWTGTGLAELKYDNMMPGGLMFGFGTLLLFYAMYVKGMTSVKGWRFLRAGTGPMLFTAFAAMAAAVCIVVAYMLENLIPEKMLAWAVAGVTALTGIDLLLSLLGSAFVPRIPGIEILPPYHSRGLDIITSPGEILKTVADAMDYQFGFRVSETWFYAFIQKAIVPLVLFWALALYAFTCVVTIGPDEQAILERFGNPKKTLDSGIHFKYPWPVDIAYRYPAKSVQTITIGFGEEVENQPAITWTEKHYKDEDLFMVATREAGGEPIPRDERGEAAYTPVSFISTAVKLHYRITDLYKYAYEKSNPKDYISDISYREVVKFMGSIDIFDLLQEKRLELAEDLRKKIQNVLTDADTGVDVFYLGFEGAHPPVEVGEAFESVIGAEEQAHAYVRAAEAYAKKTGHQADAEAYRILQEAGAYAYARNTESEAEAQMFLKRMQAYKVSPNVYRNRKLMEAFEKGIEDRRKYVVPAGAKMKSNVIFDLKDKLEFRLEDIELEGDKR